MIRHSDCTELFLQVYGLKAGGFVEHVMSINIFRKV